MAIRRTSILLIAICMKSLLLFILTCLAFVGVFLTVSASLFIIGAMAVYVLGRKLFGLSRPVA